MAGHVPWNKVDLWLQAQRAIWLSTTRPDGRPHCVPVWYWWQAEDRLVYLNTHPGGVSANNLTQQAWVVLCAGNGDDTVILEGRAHPVGDSEERSRINGFWQSKYVDPFSGAQASVSALSEPLFRVEIEVIMAWEYGAVQTRRDWRFARA